MVSISLCMIVRDEAAVLARCLDSVRDAVDEIVIVDTGSVDDTKKIAAQYTDLIFDFAWEEDFSLARNVSFSKAGMDYCMWMDADDVLPAEEKRKLLAWKERTENMPDIVMMKYAAAFDEQGRAVFVYERERLMKRSAGFLWEGRVHEAIAPRGVVIHLDICLEHRSQKKAYGTRNLDIYEKMKREGVTFSARDLFYYGRELYYHKRYEEAVVNLEQVLQREDAFAENQVEACRLAAYCCYELGRDETALSFLLEGLKFRAPAGELCCDIGKHYYDRKQWEEALFWYQGALHAVRHTTGGAFVQEEFYGYIPCIQACVCCDRMGEHENALAWHRRAGNYKPYGREFLENEEYFGRISEKTA